MHGAFCSTQPVLCGGKHSLCIKLNMLGGTLVPALGGTMVPVHIYALPRGTVGGSGPSVAVWLGHTASFRTIAQGLGEYLACQMLFDPWHICGSALDHVFARFGWPAFAARV